MKGKIKRFALRALLRMDGTPMPEPSLVDSIQIVLPGALLSDITAAIKELEADLLMTANRDDITEVVSWLLTDRGQHKAKQLA
jgi:hypothetical protein